MKARTLSAATAALFLAGFVTVWICRWKVTSGLYPRIFDFDEPRLTEALLGVFAIPLGAMVGGAVTLRQRGHTVSAGKSWMMLAAVLLWNVVVVSPVVSFALNDTQKLDAAIASLRSVADKAGFLIAGILVFLFGSNHSPSPVHGHETEP